MADIDRIMEKLDAVIGNSERSKEAIRSIRENQEALWAKFNATPTMAEIILKIREEGADSKKEVKEEVMSEMDTKVQLVLEQKQNKENETKKKEDKEFKQEIIDEVKKDIELTRAQKLFDLFKWLIPAVLSVLALFAGC